MSYLELASGVRMPWRYLNRHGLITGPTGTGKTVSIMALATGMAAQGVPVFMADVKGDLAALSGIPGAVRLDPFGRAGVPVRATVDAMGPELFARALELSDAQAGTLELAFHLARQQGLSLATLQDLRNVLGMIMRHRAQLSATVGQVSPASVGVIQRALLRLDGAFIGAPGFDVATLLTPGRISILDSVRLMRSPRLYSALLLHMLDELSTRLPEVGDMTQPRLAFFFDEAHLLFRDVPPPLLIRIEQTVRLIRSKGVGIYFASQSPDDVPATIREQLAHRIEHARSHGVGIAKVRTLTGDGKPCEFAPTRIRSPELPVQACDPVPAPMAPAIPSTRPTPQRRQDSGTFATWGVTGAALATLGLAGYGVLQLVGLNVGTVIAVAVGATLASGVFRLKT